MTHPFWDFADPPEKYFKNYNFKAKKKKKKKKMLPHDQHCSKAHIIEQRQGRKET